MVFEGQRGVQFKDITDGTSNTIMVVQAGPKSDVPWTKPADLNVDLKNPVSGFGDDKDGVFLVTFCDGSAHALLNTIDAEMLRRLFQRNDGKPIEH